MLKTRGGPPYESDGDVEKPLKETNVGVACEQQTHFRERSDDRKCICCSQANVGVA